MAFYSSKGTLEANSQEKEDESSDYEEEDSSFNKDMEALRRACMVTGTNPDQIKYLTAAATTTTNTTSTDTISDSESSEIDDAELVRKIQERFNLSSSNNDTNNEPFYLKPLKSLPPVGLSDDSDVDDEEDDYETFRAIERRFASYVPSVLEENINNKSTDPEVFEGISTTLEQETSHLSSINRNRADTLGEGFLASEEACTSSLPLISCDDTGPCNQPFGFTDWHQPESSQSPPMSSKYSGFAHANSTHFFVDAIKKNRSFQKLIRKKLIQIEARIEENKKLKERIKLLKDFQHSCKVRAGRALSLKKDSRIQLISACKSRNSPTLKVNDKKVPALYFGPVENSHVATYRIVMEKFPLSLRRDRWSDAERENLGKGVKQQFQEMLLQKSLELYSDPNVSCGDSHTFDEIITSITNYDISPENVKSFLPKVDWERLASLYVVGRSGAECEARWRNHEDPLVNHNSWTKVEDKKLLYILEQRGIHNWFDISTRMETNRTPFQCLARYQRSLNANIMKRDWTEEDDAQLRAAVEVIGEKDWQVVASNLEGRTGPQCSNRWKKTLNPAREKVGRWTIEEDKHLKVAVMLFGPKTWNKIAQFVPGRTQVQCRERWVNVLDPFLNLGKWIEEEDARLKAAISEHGHCWSKVAAALPPRTDSQCRRRWKVLLPHEVPMLQAARRVEKLALISNFVDREEERPALGSSDFLPLPTTAHVEAENANIIRREKAKRRGKESSKKQKDTAFQDDTISKRNVRTRKSKRAKFPEPALSSECSSPAPFANIRNGDDDYIPENSTSTKKITGRKSVSKKKKRAELKRCDKEFPLSVEPSKEIEIETITEDYTTSKKRKRRPSSRKKLSTGQEEFPLSPEVMTSTKKKKTERNSVPKKKKCTELEWCDQGLPLSVESWNDLGIETVSGDYTSKKKRKRKTCPKKKICTEQQELPSSPELSTIFDTINGFSGGSTSGNTSCKALRNADTPLQDRPIKSRTEDVSMEPSADLYIETLAGDCTTSKKRRKMKPCSKKKKSTEKHELPPSPELSANLNTINGCAGGSTSGHNSSEILRNTDTQQEAHTKSRAEGVSHSEEVSETLDAGDVPVALPCKKLKPLRDDVPLASFLNKKVKRRWHGDDAPLASFLNKIVIRPDKIHTPLASVSNKIVEREPDGDDVPLASFLNENVKRLDGDDVPLASLLNRKVKRRSNGNNAKVKR